MCREELASPWSKVMKRFNSLIGTGFFLGFVSFGSVSTVASAAEIYGEPHGPQPIRVHVHRKTGGTLAACGWKCRSVCPDGYSCYPLYADYNMPYGSAAYWGRYTVSGWGRY
jgi:hypothetical protein